MSRSVVTLGASARGGLTPREREWLRLLAVGPRVVEYGGTGVWPSRRATRYTAWDTRAVEHLVQMGLAANEMRAIPCPRDWGAETWKIPVYSITQDGRDTLATLAARDAAQHTRARDLRKAVAADVLALRRASVACGVTPHDAARLRELARVLWDVS